MNDPHFTQIFVTFDDILSDIGGLLLVEPAPLGELSQEISAIAEFGDDKALRVSFVDIVAFEYVGVIKGFDYTYLITEHLHVGTAVLFQVDHLHRVLSALVVEFTGLVNLAAVPRPDLPAARVGVVTNRLLLLLLFETYRGKFNLRAHPPELAGLLALVGLEGLAQFG